MLARRFSWRVPQKVASNTSLKEFKGLPLIVSWGIWLARKCWNIWRQVHTPILVHSKQSQFSHSSNFKFVSSTSAPRQLFHASIDKSGTIYPNDTQCIKVKAGLGEGSNNYAELLALKLLLRLAAHIVIFKIQVFGDCLLVINWITGESRMTNLVLNPIFDEIKSSRLVFNSVCFERVHREFNGKK